MAPREPVADADPAVRHDETVELPTRLRVERDGDQFAYGVDWKSVVPVTLAVGHKMILGTRIVWTARRGQCEPEWLGEEQSADYGQEHHFETRDRGGGAISTSFCRVEQAPFVLEAAIEVFETDIPPSHFWTPTRSHYRVLWRRTLRADVPARGAGDPD